MIFKLEKNFISKELYIINRFEYYIDPYTYSLITTTVDSNT